MFFFDQPFLCYIPTSHNPSKLCCQSVLLSPKACHIVIMACIMPYLYPDNTVFSWSIHKNIYVLHAPFPFQPHFQETAAVLLPVNASAVHSMLTSTYGQCHTILVPLQLHLFKAKLKCYIYCTCYFCLSSPLPVASPRPAASQLDQFLQHLILNLWPARRHIQTLLTESSSVGRKMTLSCSDILSVFYHHPQRPARVLLPVSASAAYGVSSSNFGMRHAMLESPQPRLSYLREKSLLSGSDAIFNIHRRSQQPAIVLLSLSALVVHLLPIPDQVVVLRKCSLCCTNSCSSRLSAALRVPASLLFHISISSCLLLASAHCCFSSVSFLFFLAVACQ